ncbi:type IV secretion system protein DotC [Cupriavidus sp. TA19]|uniref:type IV secretory system conjugative DNA transfer family protein n=1 Tax=unclassified Cupriavidus TaxID=2640874 RepID=UPI000E2F1D38|nr:MULTISPECIES: type IV secretory system conjugative DNA transfer family protein [unclassified Cupriavidus]BDB30759.1 type IV secretory system conjugative DNA transfer family protein [Cupriavidus sp. P-10]GLC94807.1 type IV secretion system protein DotC [Cupriavidus sp. TA19]
MRIDPKALLPLAAALVFASEAAIAQMSLDQISSLSADTVPADVEVTPVRAAILREAARSMGSQAGLADRCAVLVADLEKRAYVLDRQYRFSAYVTKNGLLPPVITEARDAVQSSDEQVRVADRIYKIVVKAKPVTTPPSWRDYLFVGLRLTKDVPMPVSSALPKTPAEKAFWKKNVADGWAHGQKLADEILERNLARLDRDFIGIMRYSYLLNNGMVSEPTVAVAPRVVSGDRNELRLGDTLMRVTDTGGFITDPKKWQPTVLPASGAAK